MTRILGISAFYHDSAAALVVDGRIVAAAQEERFTRKKHDPDFPTHAVAYCLKEAGLTEADLDYVAFYDKPLLKFDRLLETYLAFAPAGFKSFRMAMPVWLKDKVYLRRTLKKCLPGAKQAKFVFTEHHESHAASAFLPSPFGTAAILTIDGVGEWSTATIGQGLGHSMRLLREMSFPHSIGLLYSAFTHYCGFKVNSGEYKLMGLAPYGRPVYADLIRERLVDLKDDGSLWMDMAYFNYCQGLTMTNERFHALFGGPARDPESQIEQRHMDLAASIQAVTEEAVLRMAREAHRLTGEKNLVLAGGVALNCVANGRLLQEGPFENLWIQPASGDAGGALGAALFTWHQLLENPRATSKPSGSANGSFAPDSQQGSLLGPRFSSDEVETFLHNVEATYRRFDAESALLDEVAGHLAEGKIVGWFHGRMEFGPRALGARSILGDPRNTAMQAAMNVKIKYRESFRPFAPVVLRERASEIFGLPATAESPYMLLVAKIRPELRATLSTDDAAVMAGDPDLRRRVNIPRSTLPAITHVDFSARIQTVDAERHGRFHRLLQAFDRQTGCPVLVNTSFNVRGEPIVCTPEDAWRCFLATEMEVLVLEDCVLLKTDLKDHVSSAQKQQHLAQFAAD
jgi:carbamoyltransferase